MKTIFLRRVFTIACCVVVAAATGSAHATFHLMQIEQVIGGVNGDVTAQAVQLRCRAVGQNLVSNGRLRAWDASGANPVMVIDTTTNVPNGATGSRILITSANFNSHTSPTTVPDFTMTNVIPSAYLAAGSLTWEDNVGTIYWRLSWGGSAYTGAGNMSTLNDANGNANPPFGSALPSASLVALKFTGTASALSTTNAADYALSASPGVFINNAGTSFTLQGPAVGACCLPNGTCTDSQQAADCAKFGGTYEGDGTTCGSSNCPQPSGACCMSNGTCSDMTFAACSSAGGTFEGVGTVCASFQCPQPCSGDINGTGMVDVDDLLAVINAWGPCAGCPADTNGDGVVNVDDLLAVINHWGPCP